MKLLWFVFVVVAVFSQSCLATEEECKKLLDTALEANFTCEGDKEMKKLLTAVNSDTKCDTQTALKTEIDNYLTVVDAICEKGDDKQNNTGCWPSLKTCTKDFKSDSKCSEQRVHFAEKCKPKEEDNCATVVLNKAVKDLLAKLKAETCIKTDELPCADDKKKTANDCFNNTKEGCGDDWKISVYALDTLCTHKLEKTYNDKRTACTWDKVVDGMQYVEKPGGECDKEKKANIDKNWIGDDCKDLRAEVEKALYPGTDDCSSASGISVHITLLVSAIFMVTVKTIGCL